MTLPPIPTSVRGILGPIRVQVVDELPGDADELVFGYWDAATRTIAIRGGVPLELQWSTLYHERTHAALFEVGVANELEQALEERVCNAIAAHWIQDALHSLSA